MNTIFTNGSDNLIMKSERDFLKNLLRITLNQKAQLGNQEKEIRDRLAEIERETVERERSLLVDSQTEYVT